MYIEHWTHMREILAVSVYRAHGALNESLSTFLVQFIFFPLTFVSISFCPR